MEEEDVCPICFEEYKNPKLLPCRHSFCANCIDRLVVTKSENSQCLCPNCRLEIQLPPGGARAFISNYFIQSWPEQIYCEICGCECQGKRLTCQTCMRKTCPSCFRAHGEEKGCNLSDDTQEKPGFLYKKLRATRSDINTAYEAKMIASYQHMQVDQIVQMVHSVVRDHIWIADNYCNELAECDRLGSKTKSIPVNGIIVDFCTYTGNSLLIIKENSRVVMKVTTSEESIFIHQTHGYPKYVTCINQGMVAVAIHAYTQDKFHLFYYSSNGDQVMEYQHKPFKHISGLCFNAVTNQVCVSDRKFGYMFMVSPDGKLQTYSGFKSMRVPEIMGRRRRNRPQRIVPLCVTCDTDGNTFLFDDISGFIHIVDKNANVIALMDTDEDFFLEANHIAFSGSGQLWISDRQDGKIKVYNVESCVNYFGFKLDRYSVQKIDKEDSCTCRTCLALDGNENSSDAEESTDAFEEMLPCTVFQVPADEFENGKSLLLKGNDGNNPTRIILVPVRRDSSRSIENCPLPPPKIKSEH